MKLCYMCKHYKKRADKIQFVLENKIELNQVRTPRDGWCIHPKAIDFVTGRADVKVRQARLKGPCNMEGKLWEFFDEVL